MATQRDYVPVERVAPARPDAIDPDYHPERRMAIELPEALNLRRDRVRWGAVWAGLFAALTTMILLGLLGLAIGLTTLNFGTAAGQAGPPRDTGMTAAIWGGLIGIVAFLISGFVAGHSAAVFDRGWGAWNGALVFIVAVPITVWLAGQGLGLVLGTLGDFIGALGPAARVPQGAPNVQPIDVARTAEAARTAAWGTLIALLVGFIASALGGWLGTRREVAVDRAAGRVTGR
jgi:hypothetical protein